MRWFLARQASGTLATCGLCAQPRPSRFDLAITNRFATPGQSTVCSEAHWISSPTAKLLSVDSPAHDGSPSSGLRLEGPSLWRTSTTGVYNGASKLNSSSTRRESGTGLASGDRWWVSEAAEPLAAPRYRKSKKMQPITLRALAIIQKTYAALVEACAARTSYQHRASDAIRSIRQVGPKGPTVPLLLIAVP